MEASLGTGHSDDTEVVVESSASSSDDSTDQQPARKKIKQQEHGRGVVKMKASLHAHDQGQVLRHVIL